MSFSEPQTICDSYITDYFTCGKLELDCWLRNHALKNHKKGISHVKVVTDNADRVLGYYALAAGNIVRPALPKRYARNVPGDVPIGVLGRLAVDITAQRQHLGYGLLNHAMTTLTTAAEHIGIYALFVQAKDDSAKQFYQHYGFIEGPEEPYTLFMRIEHFKKNN